MDAVHKAKIRLRKYPMLLAQCRDSASAYATCVINKENISKSDCQAEFDRFKKCLIKAAAASNTKL
ncbi:uncharacterized protein LOC105690758 [Athalia rosae]|uniref:uncharacterized protein LOC105690758 n=1 Tax=Athalia rosae TaxID=37344 RepID=UPI002033991B|nr:uncharacterized protein LOC105690758 [Athalia rosae]